MKNANSIFGKPFSVSSHSLPMNRRSLGPAFISDEFGFRFLLRLVSIMFVFDVNRVNFDRPYKRLDLWFRV